MTNFGVNHKKAVDPKDAKFNNLTGICIISEEKEKSGQKILKEHAIVAEKENSVLRLISNVSSIRNKKSVSTVQIKNVKESCFKPAIITLYEDNRVLVTNLLTKDVLLLEIQPEKSYAQCLTDISIPGQTVIRGMAYLSTSKELLLEKYREITAKYRRIYR